MPATQLLSRILDLWLPLTALAALAGKLVWIGQVSAPAVSLTARAPIAATFAVIAVIGLPMAAMRGRARLWYALSLNVLGTLVGLTDLWHVRFYGDLWSVTQLAELQQLPLLMSSIRALVRPVDLLTCLDVVMLTAAGLWIRVDGPQPARRRPSALLAVGLAVVAVASGVRVFRTVGDDPDGVFEFRFQGHAVAAAVGLAGYHVHDLTTSIFRIHDRLTVSATDSADIAKLIVDRSSGQLQSRLTGIARGMNVILLSAESLQAFALGMKVNGEPLAPHLDAFARESLQFTAFYDQTHRGTTSDAEFMALNSLLPLPSGSVATRYATNEFRSLPHVLRERGYRAVSACGEPPYFWNMQQIHRKYGFERSWFLPDLEPGPWVGLGLDDVHFFAQMASILEQRPQPFFAFLLSSSNHHPYRLLWSQQQIRPVPWPGTMAADYLQSVRYFDQAFGHFVDALRTNGLLERSVVVVFGDHQSWLDEADLRRLWQLAGHRRDPSDLDLWRFRRRVPLLVRLPQAAGAGTREVAGGHLDVAPTILSLVGIRDPTVPWLGRDLTAPHRALVAFRDGGFTDDNTALIRTAGQDRCYQLPDSTLSCSALSGLQDEARRLVDISERMVSGDLMLRVVEALERAPPPAARGASPVLVIAHRGDSRNYPENTLPAIESAFALGADIVEVDVRLTKDGVPMLFHDDTLDRTSNGRGPFGARTFEQIRALDAGSWMDARFAGTQVPTLEEALRTAAGRGSLYLDLTMDGLAQPVAAAIRRAGFKPELALIAGWRPTWREEFRRALPGARVLRVESAPFAWGPEFFARARVEGVWGLEIGDDRLPPSFIADAAVHDIPLFVYTINDEPTMRRLIELGVRGIETDDPALLLRVASSLGAR